MFVHVSTFDFSEISCVDLEKVEGFILNAPSGYKIAGIVPLGMGRKHWYTVRKIENSYYNLDSKLKKPDRIGDSSSLLTYLQNQLNSKDKELLIIVKDGVEPYQPQTITETEDVSDTVTTDTMVNPAGAESSTPGPNNEPAFSNTNLTTEPQSLTGDNIVSWYLVMFLLMYIFVVLL